jgi:hypothetical protein
LYQQKKKKKKKGLQFMEDANKMLNLGHGFVFGGNWDAG